MRYILILALIILFLGCGGGDNASIFQKTSNQIYVSEEIGNDISGNGHINKPFKTITKAINNTKIGLNDTTTILISGGNYTEENGEEFPLDIPKNINLFLSDENNKSAEIKGFGNTENNQEVTLLLRGNNNLNGLIISSLNNIGILSTRGKNKLISVKLINNQTALGILNSSNIILLDSTIENNSYSGIELSGKASVKLVNTSIINSNIGINISENAKIDKNSENSKIIENKQCDFFTSGNENIELQGIQWDNEVFDFSIEKDCSDGNNIVNIGDATISYQPIPNNLLFTNIENEISILSPTFSESISTTTPLLRYTNIRVGKYIMVTLWKKLPMVKDGVIVNSEDIVWYWNSEMNNSPIGRIDYNKGANPINGNLNPSSPSTSIPKPLKKGRAYYFAIWEWDSKGINIISSSSISYFIVRP